MRKIGILLILITLVLTGCSSLKLSDDENRYNYYKIQKFYSSWRGVPYRYGGYSKRGVDCSGLVKILNEKEFKVILPRTTKDMAKVGIEISDRDDWSVGDLIFFKTGWRSKHVGVYIGDNRFVHASTRKGVMISKVENYWDDKFWQVRRVIKKRQ